MKTAKPLSKTAQLKQARAERKAARDAARVAETARLKDLREAAFAAVKSTPAEFGSWGVVRTRAYMKLAEIVHYRAGLKTVKADQLEPYLQQLRAVPTMPIDACAALEQVDVRMALAR